MNLIFVYVVVKYTENVFVYKRFEKFGYVWRSSNTDS